MKVKSLSRARLLATPWTAAYQDSPSMVFSRQEYCSGLPLPSPKGAESVFLKKMAENFPQILRGFLDSSVGKESVCNAGDPSSFPGSGRSAGEGIGYPLQYSRTSLVAQLVKNLLAMQETWVGKIPWRNKRLPTHSSILAWRIPWTVQSMGSDMTERLSLSFQIGN